MKKLLLSLAAVLGLGMTADAAYYVSGDFNSWNHCSADYELLPVDGNANLLSCSVGTISGQFLICGGEVGKPNWGDKLGTNGSKVQEGVLYNYVEGAGNFVVDGIINDAVLTVDLSAKTLLLAGVTGENDYDTVYIVGDLGDGWSENRTDYPMTLKAGSKSKWTATVTLTAKQNYFKFRAGSYIYATGGADVDVTVNGPAYVVSQSGNAFVLGPGSYTFSLDLAKNADEGYFQCSGVAEEIEDELAIAGVFNDWSQTANTTTDFVNGTASITIPAWAGDEFKVVVNGKWYSNASELVKDVVVENLGREDANMTLPAEATGKNVTFTVAKTEEGIDLVVTWSDLGVYTAYFDATDCDWEAVYAYAWNAAGNFGAWPGVQLEANEDGLYVFSVEAEVGPDFIIFNGGNDAPQTADLAFVMNKVYNKDSKDPLPGEIEVYLVGEFNGWNPKDEAYKLTAEGEGVYTITLADGLEGEWKLCNGTWAWSFGKNGDLEYVVNQECEAWFNAPNFDYGTLTGEVKITFIYNENTDEPSIIIVENAAAPAVPGDVNGDTEVTIADVSALIDVLLGGEALPAADVNGDTEISIADISALIDIILSE